MPRPKGSRNKLKNIAIVLANRPGKSPIEYLLSVMLDDTNELSVRMDAAKAAAPYCHSRLAQMTLEVEGTIQVTKLERTIVDPEATNS